MFNPYYEEAFILVKGLQADQVMYTFLNLQIFFYPGIMSN